MDFSTYDGETNDDRINGDLELDSGTHDLSVSESNLNPVMDRVRELFEMPYLDDLSHLEYYSKQRSFQNGEGLKVELERYRDATKLLNQINEIDSSTITMSMVDDKLDIQFQLVSGIQARLRV